eukprot:gene17307-26581_t
MYDRKCENLVHWWSLNGLETRDRGTDPVVLAMHGIAAAKTNCPGSDSAMLAGNASSYLALDGFKGFKESVTDFTITALFSVTVLTPDVVSCLFSIVIPSNSGALLFGVNSDGYLVFRVQKQGCLVLSATQIIKDDWYSVTVTRRRDVLNIYLNGVHQGSTSGCPNLLGPVVSNGVYVGKSDLGPEYSFGGQILDLRFYNYAFTTIGETSRGHVPSCVAVLNRILHYSLRQGSMNYDRSGNALNLSSPAITAKEELCGQQSMAWEGTAVRQEVDASVSGPFMAGANDFTVSIVLLLAAGGRCFLAVRWAENNNELTCCVDSDANKKIYCRHPTHPDVAYYTQSAVELKATHFALVRDGLQLKFYLDGVLDVTYQLYTQLPFGPIADADSVALGQAWFSAGEYVAGDQWQGAMANWKMWNRALSATEIAEDSTMCQALVGWWRMEGADMTDSSRSRQHGSVAGNVQPGNDSCDRGSKSMDFGGTIDDYASLTNPAYYTWLEDFTLSTWVYPRSLSGHPTLVHLRGSTNDKLLWQLQEDGMMQLTTADAVFVSSSVVIPPTAMDTWHHYPDTSSCDNELMFRRDTGDVLSMFINCEEFRGTEPEFQAGRNIMWTVTRRNREVTVYRNGLFSRSYSHRWQMPIGPVSGSRVGQGSPSDAASAWEGVIADLQFWEGAMTATEVAETYEVAFCDCRAVHTEATSRFALDGRFSETGVIDDGSNDGTFPISRDSVCRGSLVIAAGEQHTLGVGCPLEVCKTMLQELKVSGQSTRQGSVVWSTMSEEWTTVHPASLSGGWHHYAATYDSNAIRFYIDEEEVGTVTYTFDLWKRSEHANFSDASPAGNDMPGEFASGDEFVCGGSLRLDVDDKFMLEDVAHFPREGEAWTISLYAKRVIPGMRLMVLVTSSWLTAGFAAKDGTALLAYTGGVGINVPDHSIDDDWHHYTMTSNGSTVRLYVDESMVSEWDYVQPDTVRASSMLSIGGDGTVTDPAYTKGEWLFDEVVFGRGVLPHAALRCPSVVSQLPLNGDWNDVGPAKNELSGYFEADDDTVCGGSLRVAPGVTHVYENWKQIPLGAEAWTVSLFAKCVDPGERLLFSLGELASLHTGIGLGVRGTGRLVLQVSSGRYIPLTARKVDRLWHRYTVTYDGSRAEVFVDGVSVFQVDWALSLQSSRFALAAGAAAGKWLFDELMVAHGIVRRQGTSCDSREIFTRYSFDSDFNDSAAAGNNNPVSSLQFVGDGLACGGGTCLQLADSVFYALDNAKKEPGPTHWSLANYAACLKGEAPTAACDAKPFDEVLREVAFCGCSEGCEVFPKGLPQKSEPWTVSLYAQYKEEGNRAFVQLGDVTRALRGFSFGVESDGRLWIFFGGSARIFCPDVKAEGNTWYHYVAYYDSNAVRIWVNGKEKHWEPVVLNLPPCSEMGNLVIGSQLGHLQQDTRRGTWLFDELELGRGAVAYDALRKPCAPPVGQ